MSLWVDVLCTLPGSLRISCQSVGIMVTGTIGSGGGRQKLLPRPYSCAWLSSDALSTTGYKSPSTVSSWGCFARFVGQGSRRCGLVRPC
jgi:hypothetical protein